MSTEPDSDRTVCGVAGNYSEAIVHASRLDVLLALSEPVLLAPCQRPATEAMVAVCANGHRRERKICPAHLDVLTRPSREAGDMPLCLICDEAGFGDVPLTPLVSAPARPYESPVERCAACRRPSFIGCACSEEVASRG